jgi:hypothetical protein
VAGTVIGALREFLPAFQAAHPVLDPGRRRAVWALTHCRTPAMGGHLHACPSCGKQEFRCHSCNHRSCPQCGALGNAEWVARELDKRVGAPYFMVTFTLPSELRSAFQGAQAKAVFDLFFAAASGSLADVLANPRWLGAKHSGFTLVLHTWNQRMHFHPHLHAIVPGAGVDTRGRVVSVKNPAFLVPQKALCRVFRARFRDAFKDLAVREGLPAVADSVWTTTWGVHLQPFGSGENAIRYLGAYVCRSVIGNRRIVGVDADNVTFRWKDRAHGNLRRTDTLPGVEFVERFLRHVLPGGLRSIRHYGFCHPAGKKRRERVAFHTGRPLFRAPPPPKPAPPTCPCGAGPLFLVQRIRPAWKSGHDPPSRPAS